jgi:hypothetical protein
MRRNEPVVLLGCWKTTAVAGTCGVLYNATKSVQAYGSRSDLTITRPKWAAKVKSARQVTGTLWLQIHCDAEFADRTQHLTVKNGARMFFTLLAIVAVRPLPHTIRKGDASAVGGNRIDLGTMYRAD